MKMGKTMGPGAGVRCTGKRNDAYVITRNRKSTISKRLKNFPRFKLRFPYLNELLCGLQLE